MKLVITEYGTKTYREYAPELVGVVPYWVEKLEPVTDARTLVEGMMLAYGFPTGIMEGSKVNEAGDLVSPFEDDPDMKAIGITSVESGENGTIHVYSYEYGIVGIVATYGNFNEVYRFD